MYQKDANYLTYQGNVALKRGPQNQKRNVKMHRSRNGKPFAFVRLTNHVGQHYQTTIEFQAWGACAKTLSMYGSGDKIKVRARLAHGKPFLDNKGYKHYPIQPTISSIQLTFKAGEQAKANTRPANQNANHSSYPNNGNQAPTDNQSGANQAMPTNSSDDLKALEEQEDQEAEAEENGSMNN